MSLFKHIFPGWLALVGGIFLPLSDGWAEPFRVYGVDAETLATGSAATASTPSAASAFYNPGAVIRTKRADVLLSLGVAKGSFQVQDEAVEQSPYVNYTVGIASAIPLPGVLQNRIFVTGLVHFPNESIYHLEQPENDAVNLLFWGNHTQRLSLYAALGFRLCDQIGLGVGFSMLPGIAGNVAIDFHDAQPDNATDIRVGYHFAPVIGLYWHPMEGLEFGAAWRGAQRTDISIPVQVYLSDLIPAIRAEVSGFAFGMPDEIAFGAAWRLAVLPLQFHLDFIWQGYGSEVASAPTVSVYDADGHLMQKADAADYQLNNAWNIRFGINYTFKNSIKIGAGYAFVKSPVPPQSGITNLMDADHHDVSVGLVYTLPEHWIPTMRLSLSTAAQGQFYQRREFEKWIFLPGNAGFPNITFSGGAFNWKFSISAEF